jgi:transposase InsO family protein
LRRKRLTHAVIAGEFGLSRAPVSRILRRRGLSLLSALEATEARPRYERETPGEIIHIDIKKLGRFNAVGHRITGDRAGQSNQRSNGTAPGWEYVHVAIDGHSRLAFSQIHPDEKQSSAVAFLRAAIQHHRQLGVKVDRIMTDNGSCYNARAFCKACRQLDIRHIRTKPYTPQPLM